MKLNFSVAPALVNGSRACAVQRVEGKRSLQRTVTAASRENKENLKPKT